MASFLTGILSLFLVPAPFELYDIFFSCKDVGKSFQQSAQTNPHNSRRYISGDNTLYNQKNDSLKKGQHGFRQPIILILHFLQYDIIIFNLGTAAFKAYCAIWVRRSNFRHQACHHARAPSGGR